jgi:hypothetical protein
MFEVWSPKSEVWSPKSGVRSQKSEVRSRKSEVRSPKSEAQNINPYRRPLTSETLKLLSSRMSHYACWPTRCTAEWPFCYWSLFSVSEVRSLKSEVWSPKSEVRSLKSEVPSRLPYYTVYQVTISIQISNTQETYLWKQSPCILLGLWNFINRKFE